MVVLHLVLLCTYLVSVHGRTVAAPENLPAPSSVRTSANAPAENWVLAAEGRCVFGPSISIPQPVVVLAPHGLWHQGQQPRQPAPTPSARDKHHLRSVAERVLSVLRSQPKYESLFRRIHEARGQDQEIHEARGRDVDLQSNPLARQSLEVGWLLHEWEKHGVSYGFGGGGLVEGRSGGASVPVPADTGALAAAGFSDYSLNLLDLWLEFEPQLRLVAKQYCQRYAIEAAVKRRSDELASSSVDAMSAGVEAGFSSEGHTAASESEGLSRRALGERLFSRKRARVVAADGGRSDAPIAIRIQFRLTRAASKSVSVVEPEHSPRTPGSWSMSSFTAANPRLVLVERRVRVPRGPIKSREEAVYGYVPGGAGPATDGHFVTILSGRGQRPLRLRLRPLEDVRSIEVSQLRVTQNSISPTFSDGGSVADLVRTWQDLAKNGGGAGVGYGEKNMIRVLEGGLRVGDLTTVVTGSGSRKARNGGRKTEESAADALLSGLRRDAWAGIRAWFAIDNRRTSALLQFEDWRIRQNKVLPPLRINVRVIRTSDAQTLKKEAFKFTTETGGRSVVVREKRPEWRWSTVFGVAGEVRRQLFSKIEAVVEEVLAEAADSKPDKSGLEPAVVVERIACGGAGSPSTAHLSEGPAVPAGDARVLDEVANQICRESFPQCPSGSGAKEEEDQRSEEEEVEEHAVPAEEDDEQDGGPRGPTFRPKNRSVPLSKACPTKKKSARREKRKQKKMLAGVAGAPSRSPEEPSPEEDLRDPRCSAAAAPAPISSGGTSPDDTSPPESDDVRDEIRSLARRQFANQGCGGGATGCCGRPDCPNRPPRILCAGNDEDVCPKVQALYPDGRLYEGGWDWVFGRRQGFGILLSPHPDAAASMRRQACVMYAKDALSGAEIEIYKKLLLSGGGEKFEAQWERGRARSFLDGYVAVFFGLIYQIIIARFVILTVAVESMSIGVQHVAKLSIGQ